MKKILHIAAGTAQELLHTAVKLVSKLASLSLKTVKSGLVCAGKVLKRPVDKLQSVLSPYTTGRCAQRISLKQRSVAKL